MFSLSYYQEWYYNLGFQKSRISSCNHLSILTFGYQRSILRGPCNLFWQVGPYFIVTIPFVDIFIFVKMWIPKIAVLWSYRSDIKLQPPVNIDLWVLKVNTDRSFQLVSARRTLISLSAIPIVNILIFVKMPIPKIAILGS
jgi:hypothetical protein